VIKELYAASIQYAGKIWGHGFISAVQFGLPSTLIRHENGALKTLFKPEKFKSACFSFFMRMDKILQKGLLGTA